MSDLDARIHSAFADFGRARDALSVLIEQRVAERVRRHYPSAHALSLSIEIRDDGNGWSVVVTGVFDAQGNRLLGENEYLDEAAIQQIETGDWDDSRSEVIDSSAEVCP